MRSLHLTSLTWPAEPSQNDIAIGSWVFERHSEYRGELGATVSFSEFGEASHRQLHFDEHARIYDHLLKQFQRRVKAKFPDKDLRLLERQVEILLGPWLSTLVILTLSKLFAIAQIDRLHGGEPLSVLVSGADRDLRTISTNAFFAQIQSDEWNEVFTRTLLQSVCPEWSFIETNSRIPKGRDEPKIERKPLRSYLLSAIDWISRVTPNPKRFVAHVTYMRPLKEFSLSLALRNIPKLFSSPLFPEIEYRAKKRLSTQYTFPSRPEGISKGDVDHLNIWGMEIDLQSHAEAAMPETLREAINSLGSNQGKIPLGLRSPRVIFTSNSFWGDDSFKLYVTQALDDGAKLVIGQHGGNYGIGKSSFAEQFQIRVCDSFLSWGWLAEESPRVVSIGNLKDFGQNQRKGSPEGGHILIMHNWLPKYPYSAHYMPFTSSEIRMWLSGQFELVEALLEHGFKVTSKLSFEGYEEVVQKVERIAARFQNYKVVTGNSAFQEYKKAALVVHASNTTSFLETVGLGVPSFAFWDSEQWSTSERAQAAWRDFVDAGFFAENRSDAVNQITTLMGRADDRAAFVSTFKRASASLRSQFAWPLTSLKQLVILLDSSLRAANPDQHERKRE
jgi:putative transferase (TIGR04331 family)